MRPTRKNDGKTSCAHEKPRGPYFDMIMNWGFRRKRYFLTSIGRVFLDHKIFVELRIAGLHVLVWGHRTQPHFPEPTAEKNRAQCVFHTKNRVNEKASNLEVFWCFRGPWDRSRLKGAPVFRHPWAHGSRVSFMGVVLDNLVPFAVLSGPNLGLNWGILRLMRDFNAYRMWV